MAGTEDVGALHDEVERLRADNESLRRRVGWRRRGRRAAVVGLLVLGCGFAALSLPALWLHATLLNTDRYVEAVGPIASQPAVQQAVADKLAASIDSKVDYDALIRGVLPDAADALAPALAAGLRNAIHDRLNTFTRSPRFQSLWITANREAHQRLDALLTGGRSGRFVLEGDTVYADFSSAIDNVRSSLHARGYDRLANAIPADVDGRIALFQSDALVSAQGGVRLLRAVAILLPLLALLCLAGSVALSRPWRRGLVRAALGVTIAMVGLIALVAVGRSAYLSALSSGSLPRDAASSIFDSVASLLRDGVRVVFVVAVLVALVAFAAGLPLREHTARLIASVGGDRRVTWVASHRSAIQFAVVGAGALALVVWSPLTGGVVLGVLLPVVAVVLLLGAVRPTV
jgi:hypothetical protein